MLAIVINNNLAAEVCFFALVVSHHDCNAVIDLEKDLEGATQMSSLHI